MSRLETPYKPRIDWAEATIIAETPFHYPEEKVIAAEAMLRRAGNHNLAKRCADCLKILTELEAERRLREKRSKPLYQYRLFE